MSSTRHATLSSRDPHANVLEPSALEVADAIFKAATPVLRIHRLEQPLWKRKIASNPRDGRIGPWLSANYSVLDDLAWRSKGACLYLARAGSGPVQYVGISRNGVRHRWRTSPAYDAVTMRRLPSDQLFHSQCWRHMQELASRDPAIHVEVRTVEHRQLATELTRLGPPLSGLLSPGDDGEGMCAEVERWLCNRSQGAFLSWNTAMTGRTAPARDPG